MAARHSQFLLLDLLYLAQSLLERALRLKPNFSDAHLELGNLHVARNENEKAVAEFLEPSDSGYAARRL